MEGSDVEEHRSKTTSPLEDHRPPSKTAASSLSHRHCCHDGLAIRPADYFIDAGHHAGLVFALAAAHLIIVTGSNSTTGQGRCFHGYTLLLPLFVQSSLIAVPHLFLILTCLSSSPLYCSACFAGTSCCRRSSGSCDGASWVRAPGVPRPRSRGLLPLLDLLQQRVGAPHLRTCRKPLVMPASTASTALPPHPIDAGLGARPS